MICRKGWIILKIHLVRHGADEDGYRGGWSQRGLVEEGIIQASIR
ncbi:hypothetical protein [Paenibacillus sp. DCT19]|nr:hypothetical protein [Paenibacillus sp. DCT19]